MRVLISGSSGLIGTALMPALSRAGHDVIRMVRSRELASANTVYWNPDNQELHPDSLAGIDAVVNLVGTDISGARWNNEIKKQIRFSRVNSTRLLCETLSLLNKPPSVLISASAVGYYGGRGDGQLGEEASPGDGFLASVCREWEEATSEAERAGVRVIKLRIGMVLSERGGALKKLLPIFRKCLGGRLGNGNQFVSWIALDDLVSIIAFALDNPSISGAINAVAPTPLTNRQFTKTLAKAVHRPALIPTPAFLLRLVVGEMADELLLASVRIVPSKLQKHGYTFSYPELQTALEGIISREGRAVSR